MREELKEGMKGAFNEAIDTLTQKDTALEAMVVALQEEVEEFKKELSACKTAIGGWRACCNTNASNGRA